MIELILLRVVQSSVCKTVVSAPTCLFSLYPCPLLFNFAAHPYEGKWAGGILSTPYLVMRLDLAKQMFAEMKQAKLCTLFAY